MLIDATSGSELTTQDLEAITLSFVALNLLAEESELYQTKHFEYRPLHPAEATQRYTLAYMAAYKRAVSRRTDLNMGLHMRPLKKHQFWELTPAEITSLWKGRQMADRIGCDYDFYCEHVMQFADKARFARLPRPQGCYSETVKLEGYPSMVEYIALTWHERTQTSTIYPTHHAFQAERYVGGHEQNLYLNYLIQRIRTSNLPEGVLACALEKGLISAEIMHQAMPASGLRLIARAQKLMG